MSAVAAIPKPRARPPAEPAAVYYPDSDGEPMADNDLQYRCITDTRFALEQYYRENPQVYVGADLLIYFVEGEPSKSIAPDVFVALGVPKVTRRNYLVWEEGKPPDVVFEFASPRTWRADLGWKHGLYAGLGVREYFLFDPTGEYFRPILQGHRLRGKSYRPLPSLGTERGILGLSSQTLGLELWARSGSADQMAYVLRLYNPATGEWLPTPAEEAAARRAETAARRTAEARAAAAEARLAELQDELQRLRGAS